MNKIAVIQFWEASPHLETSLDIAMNLAGEETNVLSYFFWVHQIPYTEGFLATENIDDNYRSLQLNRLKKSKALTSKFFEWSCDLPLGVFTEQLDSFYLSSLSHLKRLKYLNYPLGEYLACQLFDITKLVAPDPEQNKMLLNLLFTSFVTTFKNVEYIIEDKGIDEIVLFNGRHINDLGASCAAQSKGVATRFHDRGGNDHKYCLMKDKIHSINELQSVFQREWENKLVSDEEAYQVASSLLNKRVKGKEELTSWFRRNQKEGVVPLVDPNNINIAYFGSSMDEYLMLPERHLYPTGFWEEQRTAVLDLICQSVRISPRVKIFIRLHPNVGIKADEMELWDFLYNFYPENVVVINPTDEVDSYELSKKMDLNFLFHSSIGADIMSFGIPIYAFNTTPYDYLYGCTTIKNSSHLRSIINDHLNKSCSFDASEVRKNGLNFVYTSTNYGYKYMYYRPETTLSGKFMGISL